MMKQKLILVTTLILLNFTCLSQEKGSRLSFQIQTESANEPQWVYLFSTKDNQAWFIDSLFLEKDQTTFEFNNIDINCPWDKSLKAGTLITYSSLGGQYCYLGGLDTIYFDLNIKHNDNRTIEITGVGDRGRIASQNHTNKLIIMRQHHSDTLELLRKIKISKEDLNKIGDSLNNAFEKQRVEGYFADLESQYDRIAMMSYSILIDFCGYSDQELSSYMNKMKERFPDNELIQSYPNRITYPPATEESKRAFERRGAIGRRKSIEKEITKYKEGDTISKLSLPDSTGTLISIKSINTPYILIDFWASWCAPCRELAPTIKQLLHDNKQSLTIYAISIDKSRESWLKAIDADQTQQFTHVISDQNSKVIERFNIRAIPASYLLDSNHKIIGINLSEEQIRGIIQK